MKRTSSILVAGLFIALSVDAVAYGELAPDAAAAGQANPTAQQETLYAEGTKAMDEQRWADAVTDFDRAAAIRGQHLDASLYWKAYSLDKLSRKDEARATCDSLLKQQPQSPWNKECMILAVRSEYARPVLAVHAGGDALVFDRLTLEADSARLAAQPFSPYTRSSEPATEDDIKILALNSLMRQDPAKAMPMLRSLLKSDKPVRVRKQALFVLSRSKDPQAQALLTEIATSKGEPEMQRAALQTLALNSGKDSGSIFVEVYRGATDDGVRRAALNGLFLTHDAVRMVELARGEKDLNMKRDIVSQLALMHDQAATDYMLELLK